VVNSAASLARKVKAIDGTVFCSPEPGFSILSANKSSLTLRMVDKNGNVLHTISIDK
ncbi:MAG: acid phosphatase, partial [Bacteroidales bacterium]|nr:acid phosphatase [Bacteroidales bacterium]